MSDTIYSQDYFGDKDSDDHQGGVDNEFVRHDEDDKGDREFENSIEDAHIGIYLHVLARYDDRFEDRTDYCQGERDDHKPENDQGAPDEMSRDDKNVRDYPVADCYSDHEDKSG